MGLELFKESFIGKYDGVTSPLQLQPGDICEGLNMRKVSPRGGWKARKGCTLHNTTALTVTNGAPASMHQYTHPIYDDYHFILQCNQLLYDMTNDPPANGSETGTSLGVTVGTTPGFSCQVGDWWVYADGSGKPVVYGGTTPRPLAVLSYWSSGAVSYSNATDITNIVTNNDSSNSRAFYGDAAGVLYVITMERCSGITLNLGTTVNSNAVTLAVKAMRSGTFTAVSDLSDGTEVDGDTTLAQDGSISWTASSSDTLFCVNRIMGYAYQLSWSGALSADIDLISVTVTQAASTISNKWNGAYETVTGCYFDDDSADDDVREVLGLVSNESTSTYLDVGEMTTSDNIIVGTPEPPTAILFGIVAAYGNTSDATISASYYDITGEVAYDDEVDYTSRKDQTLALTNPIFFEGTEVGETQVRRCMFGNRLPMYLTKFVVSATLSSSVRIYYMGYAPAPLPLGTYSGCVEFKGRLILWGDKQYPNRLRYSALDRPDVFSGTDSGYTQAFGAGDDILCAKNFYNELLVWKRNEVWMLEGFDRVTFGSLRITNEVGLASPQTAKVVEVGTPGLSALEPRSIAIWQDTDGVYVLDGDKPKKVSNPVDWLFNPEYSSCIAAADINSLRALVDPIRNEYHLLLPNNVTYEGISICEVVYNYATDEWYPPWKRNKNLVCGLNFKGSSDETGGNRDEVYGASSDGFIMRLEQDTTDKNASNEDQAIRQRLKTRAIAATQKQTSTWRFRHKHFWPEFKARSSGAVTTTVFPDLATTGLSTSPTTASMVNSGYELAIPKMAKSRECKGTFQVLFDLNTADAEMEIYGISYELEVKGLPNA